MKKWIQGFLAVVLLMTLVPQIPLRAAEIEEKTVTVYNNYDQEKINLRLLIDEDEVYVALPSLAKMMGYSIKNEDGVINLQKKGKTVILTDSSISYGSAKEELKRMEQNDTIYVPLTPTINYLDGRLSLINDQLILFKPKVSFSYLVTDMEDAINQGYLLVGKDDGWSVGASTLWVFLNGESSNFLNDSRQEQAVVNLLVEDDLESIELGSSKLLTVLKESGSLFGIDSELISKLDESVGGLLDKGGNLIDLHDTTIELMNYVKQIHHFYANNVNNAKRVFLNKDSKLYDQSDKTYKLFEKYISYYNDKTKNAEAELIGKFAASKAVNLTADALIGQVPLIAVGLSGLKIYSEISDLNDQASVVLLKQHYSSMQCKVLSKIMQVHQSIKKGHVLTGNEITDYVNLVRMYYHIAAAYYKDMSEVDKNAFEGNYRTAQALVNDIDRVPNHLYMFDDPTLSPSKITTEQIDQAKQTEEDWVLALKEFITHHDIDQGLWDVFNDYQSRIHLEDMDFDGVPEVMITTEDSRGSWKQSIVYKLDGQSYKNCYQFHGMLRGAFQAGDEKIYRIETSHSGTFESFTYIKDFNQIGHITYDTMSSDPNKAYGYNETHISEQEYKELKSKYIDQAKRISAHNAVSPFYKSYSPEHRSQIYEKLIKAYNEGDTTPDYDQMYEGFDVKMALIAILDKNGLHTSVAFDQVKLQKESKDTYIFEVNDEGAKKKYSVKIDQSSGIIDNVMDAESNLQINFRD